MRAGTKISLQREYFRRLACKSRRIDIALCISELRQNTFLSLAVSILEDALSVWTNLGKHSLFVWLYVSRIETGKRRIIRLDKLSSVVRGSCRTTEDSSSRRMMRLVPDFIIKTYKQTNNECLPKCVPTDNGSSSIKTAIEYT